MSVKAKKQYNLRSHKATSIQVPVELQVSDDNRFLNSILENSILSQQTNDDFSVYLVFYVAFNTVQVISRWVVGRAEETST